MEEPLLGDAERLALLKNETPYILGVVGLIAAVYAYLLLVGRRGFEPRPL